MSFYCEECGFSLWRYIAKIPSAHVGLYDDNRYPGRCLVVYPTHINHFEEKPQLGMYEFMESVQDVGSIIKDLTGADRINYAILGNAVPHVHAHVIPRFKTDPNINSSPWSRTDKASALPRKTSEKIISDLKIALIGKYDK